MTDVDREELFKTVAELSSKLVVIEAFWDGDTNGWGVQLAALTEPEPEKFKEHWLIFLRHGVDFWRALYGQVPPWSEAILGKQLGQEIADRFGVPFYFASPDKPEDVNVPRWTDWRVGRVTSRPIHLINPQEVIEQFRGQSIAVVEAQWVYYCEFLPELSVITVDGLTNAREYKINRVGRLYWDKEDMGRVIYGKHIPPRTPLEEALRIGKLIANELNVPFHFTSPDKPAHRLPRWLDLNKDDS